jgi:drug/metabolite transporter (DMT)-like permease
MLLLPIALLEVAVLGARWSTQTLLLHGYSIFFSGLIGFALWNNALRSWPASRCFLFGNLIPATTMAFAHFFLGDPITTNFWIALAFILSALLLGQADWRKIISARWSPGE